MKMTTWTSEGEMKPRVVTLAQAIAIVFFDFLCYGGKIGFISSDGVCFRRPSGILSLKECIFQGTAEECRKLELFFSRYFNYCCEYYRGCTFSSESSRYNEYLLVFVRGEKGVSINISAESISDFRVRMANAALLESFEISFDNFVCILHLLDSSFDALVAFLALAQECGGDDIHRFVEDNYLMCG